MGVHVCRCADVRVCGCMGVYVCRCAGVQVCRCAHLDHNEIFVTSLPDGLSGQLLQLLLVQVQGDEGLLRDLAKEGKLRRIKSLRMTLARMTRMTLPL